ncbi:hypothetical protein ALV80_03750 [Lactobacillus helveticus]|uniref:Uncharacterized protein n=1 Tax=Lactobacillus helveticus TaxID=1587 RepID=A0AAC8ZXA7_LACHE|nr:hypothetical protein ALV80_03750 [Lactobacillus helveticus]
MDFYFLQSVQVNFTIGEILVFIKLKWLNDKGSFSVFSTYVEVILGLQIIINQTLGILHVCGGDPNSGARTSNPTTYSPRMWR